MSTALTISLDSGSAVLPVTLDTGGTGLNDNDNDIMNLNLNEGIDPVPSSISWILGTNRENLTLIATA